MSDIQAAREQLVRDFSAIVADSEALLRSLSAAGGEKAGALRADIEMNLEAARARLRQLQGDVEQTARDTIRATDEYVHENPWQSVAIAAGVAAVVGVVVGLMLNRR
jgi:ElaB/YqjD/DUF883 family membrane-anchored ribosome-binding protein